MKRTGRSDQQLGFFTRTESKRAGKHSTRVAGVSAETLRRVGLKGVGSMNPNAKTPHMEPAGSAKPAIYFLGDCPGKEDDTEGEPFSGAPGRALKDEIPYKWKKKARYNYCVRTRPPKNRKPEFEEIECYRQSIEDDIEATKPQVVVAVGGIAVNWCFGVVGSIKICRGRFIPAKIGNHICWVYPILDPEYVLKVQDSRKEDDIEGSAWGTLFEHDLTVLFEKMEAGLDKPVVFSSREEDLIDGVEIFTGVQGELEKIERFIAKATGPISLDIETNRLRPYEAGAKCLTMSLGVAGKTIAFPFDHPKSQWTKRDRGRLGEILLAFLNSRDRPPVVIQNLTFEYEWFCFMWPEHIQELRYAFWHDTMRQAYILDERVGGHNLDFLSLINLGFRLKLYSGQMEALEHEKLEKVLRYNALDAKYTLLIHDRQYPRVERLGLKPIYDEEMRRIFSCVIAQRIGIPVDQDFVRETGVTLAAEIDAIHRDIRKLPEVKKFTQSFGTFNPASNENLVKIFRDILGKREGRTKKNKTGYTTDDKALKRMDSKLAKLILALRNKSKLKSTYCDSFTLDAANTVLYPDGKLHTQFRTGLVRTGRLSSEGPNMQNFPKRKDRWIRKMIAAPKGWVLVAADYGQLEARVVAMASQDRNYIKALKNGLDIHMVWAKKIIAVWPKTFEARGSDLKAFRSDVKNQWTFPALYGSECEPIAAALEMPMHLAKDLYDEFWEEFAEVKRWQKAIRELYHSQHYVECLSGRRRHAPLGENMVINTPVQGSASDIVVDGMNRLSEKAGVEYEWFLHPVLNIHDDLTFLVPESELEAAVQTIVIEMLSCEYAWVGDVPLSVEVEWGYNWDDMHKIGEFSTADLN